MNITRSFFIGKTTKNIGGFVFFRQSQPHRENITLYKTRFVAIFVYNIRCSREVG